jgi:hypothetical protein
MGGGPREMASAASRMADGGAIRRHCRPTLHHNSRHPPLSDAIMQPPSTIMETKPTNSPISLIFRSQISLGSRQFFQSMY